MEYNLPKQSSLSPFNKSDAVVVESGEPRITIMFGS